MSERTDGKTTLWSNVVMRVWLGVVVSLLVISPASAQSWCQPDERVLLSGEVGTFNGQKFTGKGVLSLCASPLQEPYSTVTYRYGHQQPELIFSTPADGRMWLDSQQILRRAGVDVLYFKQGDYTYAVTDCQGMECGLRTIRLMVFKGKTKILSLSANPNHFERQIDFLDDLKGSLIQVRKSGLNVDER